MSWRARGLRPWVWQRLSAAYMALFLPYLLYHLAALPAEASAWRAWVAAPLANAAWALFVCALLLHAWVGLRDVLLDYLKSDALRQILLPLGAFLFAGLGAWVLRALLTLEGA